MLCEVSPLTLNYPTIWIVSPIQKGHNLLISKNSPSLLHHHHLQITGRLIPDSNKRLHTKNRHRANKGILEKSTIYSKD